MGMIISEAGGAISNGVMNIRDIQPEGIDDVTPIYVGGEKRDRSD